MTLVNENSYGMLACPGLISFSKEENYVILSFSEGLTDWSKESGYNICSLKQELELLESLFKRKPGLYSYPSFTKHKVIVFSYKISVTNKRLQ